MFVDQPWLQKVLRFIGWAILFGVAYAQSPLFTSNQNQYFLHGLARAGAGFLSNDWLANTLDPTPAFSQLVSFSYRLFSAGWIFYVYYIALMGVYLFSLVGIVRLAFALDRPGALLIFISLLVLVHSAALRFLLSRGVGDEWTFVLEGGVAGQRVLGVVFQPSAFGVLLILSIYLFLSGRAGPAVIAAVAATYFHPTYLLGAGVLVCTYMLVTLFNHQGGRKALWIGAAALLLVLPVLLFVSRSFGGISDEVRRAQDILVHFRIPHHALVAEWLDITTGAQLLLVAGALWVVRSSTVFPVLAIGSGSALALSVAQLISRSVALALAFPWRLSVILVPLSTALLLGYLVERVTRKLAASWSKRSALILSVLCWICLIGLVAAGALRFWIESDEKAAVPEYALYLFVRETKGPRAVYMIPTKMQDFRLETGAPIYIDFKSIPYQSGEVLEWYRRNRFADSIFDQEELGCADLDAVRQEGVTHLVAESSVKVNSCDGIEINYRDSHFSIYELTK
jgi:hypothetical protein